MTTEKDTSNKSRSRRKPSIWHMVSNHQNMLYILAAGMVMGPAGFRGKHYADPLNVYPGWIPLFRNKIPADALQYATSEREYLLPCVASFDLRDLSDHPVRMLLRDGGTRDIDSPSARKRKDDIALLVRAPLPPTLLRSINFQSPEDKQKFQDDAGNVSNVDLSFHKLEVVESLFSPNAQVAWLARQPQGQLLEDDSDTAPVFGQALGGVLAMLYHMANRSDLGLAAFRLVTEAVRAEDKNLCQNHPILAQLANWIDRGEIEISEQADPGVRLFWGLIQSLIEAQEYPQTSIDVTLAYLEKQLDLPQLDQPHEVEFRSRLRQLIADMRDTLGLGAKTITELLEQHQKPLSRALLLFCLREHCHDLLGFSHDRLKDEDYLIAGILFGVRDGWLNLSKSLRDPNLSAYVAFRMADAEYRKRSESLAMSASLPPKPLRALFLPNNQWNNMTKDVAVALASKCNWNDCFRTQIALHDPSAEIIKNQDSELVIGGRIKEKIEKIDKNKFLHRLGQSPSLAPEIEAEVRKSLQKIEEKANRDI